MAVRADYAVAGGYYSLLGQKGVFNAHLADIIKVADSVTSRELATLLGLLRRLYILVGDKVVEHYRDSILIENAGKAGLFKLVHRHRGGDVVAEHDIELRVYELTCAHAFQTCVCSQNLLSHRHSHNISFLSLFYLLKALWKALSKASALAWIISVLVPAPQLRVPFSSLIPI